MAQHIVELNVVDLVSCLGLEPCVKQSEFCFARVQLEVVHNLTEASHRNETAGALVLILEERLDQKAAEANLFAEALQGRVKLLLLLLVKHIKRVQNGRRRVC